VSQQLLYRAADLLLQLRQAAVHGQGLLQVVHSTHAVCFFILLAATSMTLCHIVILFMLSFSVLRSSQQMATAEKRRCRSEML